MRVRSLHFVSNPIFDSASFPSEHPLGFRRVGAVVELCRPLGWLDDTRLVRSDEAPRKVLERFHAADYLDALQAADENQSAPREVRRRYRLGTPDNPIFRGMYARPARACGGSLKAAELVQRGGIAFHPAGGTHHGRPDRAAGFCFLNDPVFAVLGLLDGGAERVLYVDFDAHHGDGVQDAFAADERVFTFSVHEAGRWPRTGALDDRGLGRARNLPLPAGGNDSELAWIVEAALLPWLAAITPDALVVQCGADGLFEDPLCRLEYTNGALWQAVADLVAAVPRAVVLGGGGYHPQALVHCWSGLWATLDGRKIPDELPAEGQVLLAGLGGGRGQHGNVEPRLLTSLADPPRPAPIRDEVRRAVARLGAT
ncbi:MAG TPA: acetoin utilization protein AcuC [Alphaproteobacteria bacterium]|nr:acetoin utilization protein AcuC [Alphaproteobacteria bacterium]